MEEICSLPVHTVSLIPRSVRPLFATVLAAELYNADIHGICGFVRFSTLAKCVLRCPPREKKKKRVVISSLLSSRLQRWQQGDLVALWQEAKMESNGTIHSSRKLSLQNKT